MARFILTTIIAAGIMTGAYAATEETVVYDNFQTIYTETPDQS